MKSTIWGKQKIEELVLGEPEVWRAFVHEFGPRFFRFFCNTVHDEEEANELVAETLKAVLASLETFGFQSSLETWLFQICRHKLYDRHRGSTRFQNFLRRYSPFQRMSLSPPPDPEELLVSKDEILWMNDAMRSLPLEFREILTLRFMEELSIKEVAQITKLSVDKVKNITRDGKRRLRNALEGMQRKESNGGVVRGRRVRRQQP